MGIVRFNGNLNAVLWVLTFDNWFRAAFKGFMGGWVYKIIGVHFKFMKESCENYGLRFPIFFCNFTMSFCLSLKFQ